MVSVFKMTGIILCFLSCSAIGLYQASQVRRRKILLTEFQDFIQQISTEMGYFKEPLPMIFQRILERNHDINHPIHQISPITLLLRQCLIETTNSTKNPHSNNDNFYTIWKNIIESTYENEPLNAADIQILSKCGAFLGQSDFQSQKGHFKLLEGELQKQISESEDNIRTKGSLYSKAGVSIGAVLAIALL